VLGLIGGIGSGKSRVAAELARHGGRVIAADQIGHDALRDEDIKGQVVARWGTDVLDGQGAVNRRRLGQIVFADAAERRALEALVFPWIERRIREAIDQARADPAVRLIILDAAIMVEAGWDKVCDRIVYVHAPREQRLKRLAEQRGWGEADLRAREEAQLPLADKQARADVTVDNSGSPQELARQVEELVGHLGIHGGGLGTPPQSIAGSTDAAGDP